MTTDITTEEALKTAAEALRLCRAGEEAAGLALYRSCARPRLFGKLPLGLHVHLLEEAGRAGTAETLRAMVVRNGGDLAWRASLPNAPLAAVADEYADLYARGFANPLIVSNHLRVLTASGRLDEVAALFDRERLLCEIDLGGELADAVAQAMLEAETGIERGSRLSVREMREIKSLHELGHPVFDALLDRCRAETSAYLRRWAASDHPLAPLVPQGFEIGAWGLVSRGEGYNTRHQHTVGWATGVFYPIGLPDEIAAGALRIGGWIDPVPPGWPEVAIRPRRGLLVLMPSYYVHWTDPLGVPGLRLSVAYDAIPAEREEEP